MHSLDRRLSGTPSWTAAIRIDRAESSCQLSVEVLQYKHNMRCRPLHHFARQGGTSRGGVCSHGSGSRAPPIPLCHRLRHGPESSTLPFLGQRTHFRGALLLQLLGWVQHSEQKLTTRPSELLGYKAWLAHLSSKRFDPAMAAAMPPLIHFLDNALSQMLRILAHGFIAHPHIYLRLIFLHTTPPLKQLASSCD